VVAGVVAGTGIGTDVGAAVAAGGLVCAIAGSETVRMTTEAASQN
jgi:hypothetical protein